MNTVTYFSSWAWAPWKGAGSLAGSERKRTPGICNKTYAPRQRARGELLQPLPGCVSLSFSWHGRPAMTDLSFCWTASHGRDARAAFLFYPGVRFRPFAPLGRNTLPYLCALHDLSIQYWRKVRLNLP